MRITALTIGIALTLSPALLATERPADPLPQLERVDPIRQITRSDPAAQPSLMLYRLEPVAVEGSYTVGGHRLEFSGRRLGDEAAEVRFWSSDTSFELESRILSRHEGRIGFGGVEISGRGAIDEPARELLAELAASPAGQQLPRIALDLGCRLTHRDAAPLLAAFLQPWQIIFKHTGQLRVDASTLQLAGGCIYSPARPGRQIVLLPGEALAYVPFFTPLDAEGGWEERAIAAYHAPCGAMCRGACGADCSSPLCQLKSSGCEWLCPTHSFCRFHDSCYDGCNSVHGCSSDLSWICKRGCDDKCLQQYSALTCAAWSQGLGPSDGWVLYNECSGGSDCDTFDWLQVNRGPGLDADDMNRRSWQLPGRSRAGSPTASIASEAGADDRAAAWTAGQPAEPGSWRQWGPDAVYAFTCHDDPGTGTGGGGDDGTDPDGGDTHCTDCTCQGEFTSFEGEVCGTTTDELVDECWNSCY